MRSLLLSSTTTAVWWWWWVLALSLWHIWQSSAVEESRSGTTAVPPPRQPPASLLPAYTVHHRVPIAYMYVDDTMQGEPTQFTFTADQIRMSVKQSKNTLQRFEALTAPLAPLLHSGSDSGSGSGLEAASRLIQTLPKTQWILYTLTLFKHLVAGKKVCVYGSMEPWLEAYLLELGADLVVVVEYNYLTYEHDRIVTIAAPQFDEFYASSSPYHESFDLVISPSAFDHDGLGRYGDPLNPKGDLEAMQKVSSLLKPQSGLLMLTVPIGPDVVVFNLHRRYGRVRLPMLLQGYEVVHKIGWNEEKLDLEADWRQTYEPIFILKKEEVEGSTMDQKEPQKEL